MIDTLRDENGDIYYVPPDYTILQNPQVNNDIADIFGL
jgi:hypothetical protein